jgi:hypothetical protein
MRCSRLGLALGEGTPEVATFTENEDARSRQATKRWWREWDMMEKRLRYLSKSFSISECFIISRDLLRFDAAKIPLSSGK